MRRFLKILAVIAAAIVLAAIVAFLVIGPDRLWEQFGPADLGDVDFATLQRRDTPNDALACLPEFCAAKADIAAPVIARPFGDVFLAVQEAVVHEPGLEQVDADSGQGTLRFVQRSKLHGLPRHHQRQGGAHGGWRLRRADLFPLAAGRGRHGRQPGAGEALDRI